MRFTCPARPAPLRPLAAIAALLLLSACDAGNSITGPERLTVLRVFVRNDTNTPLAVAGLVIAPGQSGFESAHTPVAANAEPPFLRMFEIRRDNIAVARVTYRVIRYEEGLTRDVTISVTEPSPSEFAAATADTSWITIVAIQQL